MRARLLSCLLLVLLGCPETEAPVAAPEVVDEHTTSVPAAAPEAPDTPPPARVALPEWITLGSRVEEEDGRVVVYGVGKKAGVKNPALARSAASAWARAEVGRVFDREVRPSGGSLNGVHIVDHWVGPDDTHYALARLAVDENTVLR